MLLFKWVRTPSKRERKVLLLMSKTARPKRVFLIINNLISSLPYSRFNNCSSGDFYHRYHTFNLNNAYNSEKYPRVPKRKETGV